MVQLIDEQQAIDFLMENKAYNYQIVVSPSDYWIGKLDDNENVIGVIGLLMVGSNVRIKSFFVKEEYRKNGIGTELLKYALNRCPKKYTVFGTKYSKSLFEKNGFVLKRMNEKNQVAFLEKEMK